MPPSTPSRRSPIRTHIHGRRPRRHSAFGGFALLPARSSGFRHSRARLLGVLTAAARIWAPVHAGHSHPSGNAPRRHAGPQATAATPLRVSRTGHPNARNRIVVSTDGRAPSGQMSTSRSSTASTTSRTRYRPCPTRSTSPVHRSANQSGAAAKVASRRSGGRGLPSTLSHSRVRLSHQPPAAVPCHSLSSPESRRQRERTRGRCSAATEYRGTRRDSRPLRLWQWHRRTESGQNPAPVRVRPRWSSRIPTRIAHGFGHDHARVVMEGIGQRAVIPRWRSPHRTPRISTRTRGAPDRMCRLPPGSLQTLPAVEHEARHGVTVEANRLRQLRRRGLDAALASSGHLGRAAHEFGRPADRENRSLGRPATPTLAPGGR